MKKRIDQFLVDNNYFSSREKSKRAIMAGIVLVNEEKVYKAGETFKLEELVNIRIKGNACPYVSRAGLKLEKAISEFNIKLDDKVMLDVGSSTGGFCDCALQNNIKKVYALDVGTNQLDYKIRTNQKVEVYEQVNFRTIENDFFEEKFDIITMDVSFISATLLIENVVNNLKEDGVFICLIKPQFEAGVDAKRDKNGVILDKIEYYNSIIKVQNKARKYSLFLNKFAISPITGKKGNVEYLCLFTFKNNSEILIDKKNFKGEK